MPENRASERERCFAQALLPGLPAYGYIADISPSGIRVRIPGDCSRPLAAREIITVSPEDMAIPPFRIEVEYKWIRTERMSTIIGYQLIACLDEGGRECLESLYESYREPRPAPP
jgi:hypothetical protein